MSRLKESSGPLFDSSAPKKPTNLTVNSDLLARAKALKINISMALEEKLTERLLAERRRLWLEENQAGIAEYNDLVAEQGVFSDGLRRF